MNIRKKNLVLLVLFLWAVLMGQVLACQEPPRSWEEPEPTPTPGLDQKPYAFSVTNLGLCFLNSGSNSGGNS